MYRRVVVKVGTRVLSNEDGTIDATVAEHLVEQIATVKRRGVEVVLVSSGAVGTGRGMLSLKRSADLAAQKQVFAAVGQVRLMSMYADFFERHKLVCAQVLATKEDFRDRSHYLNMKNCLENLLREGVIPVVNENDVVAVSELLFTDNDELAGLLASQLNADAVIILTSVEGVLAGDPNDANAAIIHEVDFTNIGSLEKYVTSEKTAFGRGGMLTKFAVAHKLATEGIATHIARGTRKNALVDSIEGKQIGTKFLPARKLSSVKRRIAHSEGLSKGAIYVNDCAEDILFSKKIVSLLPVGITKVEGDFRKGDIIEIRNEKKQKLGFGIAQYNAARARESAGRKNARALIHYDYLYVER